MLVMLPTDSLKSSIHYSMSTAVNALYRRMNPCVLCPHHCGVNRFEKSGGRCRTGREFSVASCNVHSGEEPPISGFAGSGAIFFTNCNLNCVFCQNYPISQLNNGNVCTVDKLAAMMLGLQEKGVHNINLVTPTHVAPQIAEALLIARNKGLSVPIVYNSGGYEAVETLRLLEGFIDIYMPDAKYFDDAHAEKFSNAGNYRAANQAALKEMYRQVGTLSINSDGIARKGLLIRHLVLPNDLAGTRDVLTFIKNDISPDTYISLMAQYHPAHRAFKHPELSRPLNREEYEQVLKFLELLGLENGWRQEL